MAPEGRWGMVGLLAVIAGPSCLTTTFHQGRVRPAAEAATFAAANVSIEEIDGNDGPAATASPFNRFAVAPGPHVFGVRYFGVSQGYMVTTTTKSTHLSRICVDAKPGVGYTVWGVRTEDGWSAMVFEGARRGALLPSESDKPLPALAAGSREVPSDCDYDRLFPKPVAQNVAPPPPPPAPVEAGKESGQGASPVSNATTPPPDAAAEATATAPPSTEDQPSVAQEIPTNGFSGLRLRPLLLKFNTQSEGTPPESGARAAMALWKGQPIWLPPTRPLLNIGLTIGAAFGGGQLLRATYTDGHTEDMHAGAGFVALLGVMFTPFWVAGDAIGLGVGGDVGLKFNVVEADNAHVNFLRYPVAGTGHILIRTAPQWFLMLAGGVEKHLDVELWGTGEASALRVGLTSRLGGLGRAGIFLQGTDKSSAAFALGFNSMTYDGPGGSVNANSFSLWLTMSGGVQHHPRLSDGPPN